jgi:hypothetical protein
MAAYLCRHNKMIAGEVNMNWETVGLILAEEFGMRKIYANMVPRNLTKQQRNARLSAVFEIQVHYSDAAASLLIWPRTLQLLFISKIKSAVQGHNFESTEDIQRSVTQALKDVPHAAFQECYKQWQHRWKSCVQAQGMHFEGDHIAVDE